MSRRKNAGEGYGYMFHGAFSEKADAVKKERATKGAFIKGRITPRGYRYIVMSPRTNPIKRRKRMTREAAESWLMHDFASEYSNAAPRKRKQLEKKRAKLLKIAGRQENPTELLVMGANPQQVRGSGGLSVKWLPVNQAWAVMWHDKIIAIRTDRGEAITLMREWERGQTASQARNPNEITVPAGAEITIRVNPTQLNPFGFGAFGSSTAKAQGRRPAGPGLIQTSRQKRVAKAIRRARGISPMEVLNRAAERHPRRRGTRKGSASNIFHELYGRNPAELCGHSIGGLQCSRKPGHKGPHLPQGATMRTRKRLPQHWQPNPSAEAIREGFTGRASEKVSIYDEPCMPAGDYAQLGTLLALYVKPISGGQVQHISFPPNARPILISDTTARQIYFVGGDQDVSQSLAAFMAREREPGSGIFELGQLRRIDYKQRKEHVEQPEIDEWRHEFGEESGVRPILLFNLKHKRLLLEGGEYTIRPEGIVN